MPYVALGAQLVLLGVLALAAAGKARPAGFTGFVTTVGAFGVARRARTAVALAVVAAEIVAAGLLATPWTRTAGLAVAAVLVAVFAVATARVARRGDRVVCHCFGAVGAPVGRVHVVRNTVLLVIAVSGLVAAAASGPSSPGAHPAGVALVAVVAAALVLLGRHADDLAVLFRADSPRWSA